MKSNQMTVIVAVALLVAAWVNARGERQKITVAEEAGSTPVQRFYATPAPPPAPPPPVEEWAEPHQPDAPVAETEPIAEADDGLAPYPAWNGYDLDCSDMDRPVRVDGPDPHRLDRDGDGVGCESR